MSSEPVNPFRERAASEVPEDLPGEVRYISPRVMNEVKKRLIVLDQLEMQMGDIRSAMLHLIAGDTRIDIEHETWAIDLDHGCVVREVEGGPADAEQ